MEEFITLAQIDEATDAVRSRISVVPKIGIILGSGLGDLAEAVENATIVSTTNVPHWPQSTVEGHKGRLVIGKLAGQSVLVMQGRIHLYEGYSKQQVT